MKVLFLDIDGVLNYTGCKTYMVKVDGRVIEGLYGINKELTKILNDVLTCTGAKVVISSSWRLGDRDLAQTKHNLKLAGFTGEIIGETPDLCGQMIMSPKGKPKDAERGDEIQAWLDLWAIEHPQLPVERFAIVDDYNNMAHLQGRLAQTSSRHGIRPKNAKKLISLLNGEGK